MVLLCCRCRRESPPGKFCAVCGGLLHAVPLSGKMPEPIREQPAPPSAQSPQSGKAQHIALIIAAAAMLPVILALAVWLIFK